MEAVIDSRQMARLKSCGAEYMRGNKHRVDALVRFGWLLATAFKPVHTRSASWLAKQAGFPGNTRNRQFLVLASKLLYWDKRWATALKNEEVNTYKVRMVAKMLLREKDKELSKEALEHCKTNASEWVRQWSINRNKPKRSITRPDELIDHAKSVVMHMDTPTYERWVAWKEHVDRSNRTKSTNAQAFALAMQALCE